MDATFKIVLWDVFADWTFVKVKFVVDRIAQKRGNFFRSSCSSKGHAILESNFVKLRKTPSKATY